MCVRRPVVALALLLAAMPVCAGVNRWTTHGPYAGYIEALAMDPTAPDTIYAGTYSAGAFKTVDGGAHWQFSNTGFTELQGFFSVQALAIDPHAPTTIYAGMDGSGVFKSTDGGVTWKLRSDGLADFYDGIVEGIAIDPSDSSTLYLATLHGVFKSTDAGCTWVKKSVGLPEANGTSYTNGITIDASNPSVLYLGTFANLVYKSADGADSWTPSGAGLPYSSAGGPVVDPANPSHLLVTDGFSIPDIGGGHGGIYASDDAGASWHPAGSTLPDTFYAAVVFDPAAPGRVYTTGAQGVFRSDDGGVTWTPSSSGLSELVTGPLLVGPGTRLLVGTHSQGVFRSDDLGATWTPETAGIAAAQWASFSVGVSNPNVILAAGSGDVTGIARSNDGGATWAPAGTGLGSSGYGVAVAVDPNDAQVLFASQWPTIPTTYKSNDGGATWAPADTGLNDELPYAFAVDPSNSLNVYASGGNHFYRSTDGGASWTPSSTLLGYAVPILARGSGLPLLTVSSGVPYRSFDAGDTWNPADVGLSGVSIRTLAAAPSDSSRLYASAGNQGIFESTDGGDTWTPLPADLSTYFVGGLAVDPADPNHVFASTRNAPGTTPFIVGQGVLESHDGGASWSPFNQGLDAPAHETSAIAFASGGQTLYISTLEGIHDYSFASAPAPLPANAAPFDGPKGGGTAITITGTGFQAAAAVAIGGASASSVVVVDAATITAVTPAGAAGAQDVVVQNPDGQFETLPRGFVYDFDDVSPNSDFHDAVAALTHAGITAGCGAGLFCPYDPLTRGQAAVLIEKAIHGADTPPTKVPGSFDDVLPCSPEGPYILELSFEGITAGCGMDVYCPDAPNTRAQGAVFILKAEHGSSYVPPAASGTVFADVPASAFAADFIEQLAAEGLTVGCGSGDFCPDAPLTRGQAAAYISASLLAP